jgi:hypothetical protein
MATRLPKTREKSKTRMFAAHSALLPLQHIHAPKLAKSSPQKLTLKRAFAMPFSVLTLMP